MNERIRGYEPDDRTDTYSAPVLIFEFSMIEDRGLTDPEKSKLLQLGSRISDLFKAAGVTIRLCKGVGEGDQRTIGFVPGLIGYPLISFPASHFLVTPEEELLAEVETTIERLSRES